MTRSHAFSRALRQPHVITSSFDWLNVLSVSYVIGQSNYFGIGFTTLKRKPLYALDSDYPVDSAIQSLSNWSQGLKRTLLLIVSVRIASHAEVLRHGFVLWERTVGPVVLCQKEGLSILTSSSEAKRERTPRTRVSLSVRISRDFSRLPQKESLLAGKEGVGQVFFLSNTFLNSPAHPPAFFYQSLIF